MKSDTHNWFGRSAWNWRWTRSCGQGALSPATVVCTIWPRLMPCNPARRINRSTVHLATSMPSRRSCFRPSPRHSTAYWHPTLAGFPGSMRHRAEHDNSAVPGCAVEPRACGNRTGRSATRGRSTRPGTVTMLIDKRPQDLVRRSSSAWAKYALAGAISRLPYAVRGFRALGL